MRIRVLLACVVLLAVKSAPGQDGSDPVPERIQGALDRAATALGARLEPHPGIPGALVGALTSGLTTCDRIDLEVRVRAGAEVEVLAYPRVEGERLDPRRAADRPALVAKLGEPSAALSPLAWVADGELPVRARCVLAADDADAPARLERALLAAPALDREVEALGAVLRPALSEEEVTAKLKEAAAADEAGRARILASLAPYLPELSPSATPGWSAFAKVVMNRRGAAFDAFRFRVPPGEGDQRLVWAFAYPPGTAKGWFLTAVSGSAPRFVKFHRGRKYEGTGVPDEHATLLQRTETPLAAGGEYVIWFSFKVDAPVDMYVALGCHPFVKSDRDAPAVLEEALGLEPVR